MSISISISILTVNKQEFIDWRRFFLNLRDAEMRIQGEQIINEDDWGRGWTSKLPCFVNEEVVVLANLHGWKIRSRKGIVVDGLLMEKEIRQQR